MFRPPGPPNTVIPGRTWTFVGAPPACVVIAGINSMMAPYARALGMAVSVSLVIVVCRRTLCTSTMGDSPVTVTVSWTVPTLSSAFTVAVKDPVSSMASRLSVVKPVRVKVTV